VGNKNSGAKKVVISMAGNLIGVSKGLGGLVLIDFGSVEVKLYT
jgi:hypothetical protein